MNEHPTARSGSNAEMASRSRRRRPAEYDGRSVGDERAVDEILPSLEPGITLLETDGERALRPLQALVVDHLLTRAGPTFWVDAKGHAATTSLARLAPSRRLLERIHVARGFTAPQHFAIVWNLRSRINREIRRALADGADQRSTVRSVATDDSSADTARDRYTPSLLVAPAFDAFYREADGLDDDRAGTLQRRGLERLAAYARGYDVPVVVTRVAADEFGAPIASAADRTIHCERTRLGPRFVGEAFETLVYPVDGGRALQTTIAYWQELLATRARRIGIQPSPVAAGTDAALEDRWQTFRRGLRRRNEARFDRLFEYARKHADAASLLNHHTPLLPALVSIDLEQEIRLDDLDGRLEDCSGHLEDHDDRLGNHVDRLEGHEDRIERHENRLERHEDRIDRHEDRLDRHEDRLERHEDRIERHEERLERYENRLAGLESAVEGLQTTATDATAEG